MLAVQGKKRKVDAVIQQLALQACQDTIIGSTLDRGVSGGEVTTSISCVALPCYYSPCSSSHALYMSDDWAQQMPKHFHVRLLSCRDTYLALPHILRITRACLSSEEHVQAPPLPAPDIFCALQVLGLIAGMLTLICMLLSCCAQGKPPLLR